MRRRTAPTTPRLSPRAHRKAQSLMAMTHTDEQQIIEAALDLLFLALTKQPDSIPKAVNTSPKNPYRQTMHRPLSLGHILHGLEIKGATTKPTKRNPPNA